MEAWRAAVEVAPRQAAAEAASYRTRLRPMCRTAAVRTAQQTAHLSALKHHKKRGHLCFGSFRPAQVTAARWGRKGTPEVTVTADIKLVSSGSSSEPPSLIGAASRSSRDVHPSPPKLGLHVTGALGSGDVPIVTMCPGTGRANEQPAQGDDALLGGTRP